MSIAMRRAVLGAVVVAGCGSSAKPAAGMDSSPSSTSSAGTTGGTAGSTTGSGSTSSAGSSSTSSASTNTSTSTGVVTTGYDTDYPIEPGCDGSDESYGGYVDPESSAGTTGATSGLEETGIGMGDIPLGVTVFQVQRGEVPAGTFVELSDVVVTAPPVLADSGGDELVYVQELDGGPESGIVLRFPVDASVAPDLQPGDRVAVEGVVVDRYVFRSIEVRASAGEVFDLGTAEIPPPVTVPTDMLGAGSSSAEALESVLVSVQNVMLVDPDPCDGEVEVQSSIHLDDRFLRTLGESIPIPPEGLYVEVRGPLVYTYNGFEIAPRDLDDIFF